ncbi:MAG: holin family protein [Pseudomonadota bacterium]
MGLSAGVLGGIFNLLFGNDRNAIAETVGVFRANAEGQAVRDAQRAEAALQQFAQEFTLPRKGLFDRMIDGLNRVPRPALALGTLGLFIAAMVDPIWFAARMQGIALVPEPLWWLLGAVVSFYFGARHQAKTQEFQRSVATSFAQARAVTENLDVLNALDSGAGAPSAEAEGPALSPAGPNAALAEWRHRDDGS